MSTKGLIFDIKELAVFDGPGIRTTVFFKGCPMACSWCHNPEGLSYRPQLMVSTASCTRCGACSAHCPLPDTSALPGIPADCTLCGKCLRACPLGLRRIAGEEYTVQELAIKLLRNAAYLRSVKGGFTISGGEPTGQGEFLLELLAALRGNHRAIETSGCCSEDLFSLVIDELEFVLMDIKIVNPELHFRCTGRDNNVILANLEKLKGSGKPFIIRIPLIPGITDTEINLKDTAECLKGKSGIEKVELLPYHETAGAKYGMLGIEYRPCFEIEKIPNKKTNYFLEEGIPCSVL